METKYFDFELFLHKSNVDFRKNTETLNHLNSEKPKLLIQPEKLSNELNKTISHGNRDEFNTYDDINGGYMVPTKRPLENESMSYLISLPKRDPGKPSFLERCVLRLQEK